jgi:hypothetical protein
MHCWSEGAGQDDDNPALPSGRHEFVIHDVFRRWRGACQLPDAKQRQNSQNQL